MSLTYSNNYAPALFCLFVCFVLCCCCFVLFFLSSFFFCSLMNTDQVIQLLLEYSGCDTMDCIFYNSQGLQNHIVTGLSDDFELESKSMKLVNLEVTTTFVEWFILIICKNYSLLIHKQLMVCTKLSGDLSPQNLLNVL